MVCSCFYRQLGGNDSEEQKFATDNYNNNEITDNCDNTGLKIC